MVASAVVWVYIYNDLGLLISKTLIMGAKIAATAAATAFMAGVTALTAAGRSLAAPVVVIAGTCVGAVSAGIGMIFGPS